MGSYLPSYLPYDTLSLVFCLRGRVREGVGHLGLHVRGPPPQPPRHQPAYGYVFQLVARQHCDFSKPSRRTGLAADARPGKGSEWRGIWGNIVISENLPRRTGLAANAGPGKGFEWRGIRASIVISENLPRRTGLAANAGPGKGLEGNLGQYCDF